MLPGAQVPLRLTVFYPPDVNKASIIAKPLSPTAEWFCSAVKGFTDASGSVQLELMLQVRSYGCFVSLDASSDI